MIPKGFTEEELPLLYVRFRELCEQAISQQGGKKQAELHPLIVRLGFWLRENAGPIADDMDAKRKYRKK